MPTEVALTIAAILVAFLALFVLALFRARSLTPSEVGEATCGTCGAALHRQHVLQFTGDYATVTWVWRHVDPAVEHDPVALRPRFGR